MTKVQLTLAISDYDHVRDLTSGRVVAEGIDLVALDFAVEEIFYRFTTFREWDVSEMSLCKYVSLIEWVFYLIAGFMVVGIGAVVGGKRATSRMVP